MVTFYSWGKILSEKISVTEGFTHQTLHNKALSRLDDAMGVSKSDFIKSDVSASVLGYHNLILFKNFMPP